MPKIKKIAQSTPDSYVGLDIKKNNAAHLVEDVHMLYYIFDNQASVHIIKEAIAKQWSGCNDFLTRENKQTILCYHENFFKVNPPKDQLLEVTGQYVWAKMITLAVDRRTTNIPRTESGRKSTIGLCIYKIGTCTDNTTLKTPQAKACLKLFTECITGHESVTEEILRKYIEDHAAELKTKQDPWRIFQYYRPNLIEGKFLTRQ